MAYAVIIYKTIPPLSVKLEGPFALFRSKKGGGIVNTWNEMIQNGFWVIDHQRKIAEKSVSDQDDAAEIVKEILVHSYINYLTRHGKEES